MKIKFIKSLVVCLIVALALNVTACTYRANGSVIQDVTFSVSYKNTENENVDVNATLSLYKTFAPKTSEHLLKLIKDGFYNDTQVVFNDTGKYLILGSFKLEGDEYKDIITENTVKGEFTKNGWQSKLKVGAGTLVMLREPDTGKGDKKYNTGKASFAIILEDDVSGITNEIYTVFGKVSQADLEAFITMRDDMYKDDEGFVNLRYVADRDDNDNRIVENGKYVNSYEFYIEVSSNTYYDITKTKLDYGNNEIEDYKDQELYEKLSKAYTVDLVALPINSITAKNFKIK